MDHQLKRLNVFLQVIDQRGEKAQTINLLAQKNVPITFVTAPAATDKPADPTPPAPPTLASAAKPTPAASKDKGKAHPKTKEKEKSASSGHNKKGSGKTQPFDADH